MERWHTAGSTTTVPAVSDPLRPTEAGVAIAVWVVPGSSRTVIDGRHGDHVKIRVSSPPEGGKANDEVSALLGELLGTKPTLTSGMRGRSKVFEVSPIDIEFVRRKLNL